MTTEPADMEHHIDGVVIHQEDEDTYYILDGVTGGFISTIDFEFTPEPAVVEVLYSRFNVMRTEAIMAGDQVQADKISTWIDNLNTLRTVMRGETK